MPEVCISLKEASDMRQQVLSGAPFKEAALTWLESRKKYLAPRTYLDYQNYIKILSPFFGSLLVLDITRDMMEVYQEERVLKVCPASVNKELSIIVQMRAELFQPIKGYKPLPMPKDYESPGRRLTDPEEAILERTFRAAADHPLWNTAALASLLSMKSGLGPGEMLSLKLKDVSLGPPALIVVPRRGAKRKSRERAIVLSQTAAWALQGLLELAKKRGANDQDHYLFPSRRRNHTYDPTAPLKGYREGLRALLVIAGVKVRRYDFRHHAVSVALSNPLVPLKAAKDYFGWVSERMIKKYAHINIETMKVVAAALENKKISTEK